MKKLNGLKKRVYELEIENKQLRQEKSKLESENKQLREALESLINEKQKLVEKLDKIQKERPSISLNELIETLRRTVESMELKPSGEALKYAVENFEVEIKSGLEPQAEGLKLIYPLLEELRPESLSVIKLSLRARPRIRRAER